MKLLPLILAILECAFVSATQITPRYKNDTYETLLKLYNAHIRACQVQTVAATGHVHVTNSRINTLHAATAAIDNNTYISHLNITRHNHQDGATIMWSRQSRLPNIHVQNPKHCKVAVMLTNPQEASHVSFKYPGGIVYTNTMQYVSVDNGVRETIPELSAMKQPLKRRHKQ